MWGGWQQTWRDVHDLSEQKRHEVPAMYPDLPMSRPSHRAGFRPTPYLTMLTAACSETARVAASSSPHFFGRWLLEAVQPLLAVSQTSGAMHCFGSNAEHWVCSWVRRRRVQLPCSRTSASHLSLHAAATRIVSSVQKTEDHGH